MHAIWWPALLQVRRNHNMFLYFHALLPYFSQTLHTSHFIISHCFQKKITYHNMIYKDVEKLQTEIN